MSALYAESSAVLRWLLGHPDADKVQSALASASTVVTSGLTTVEVARALQRLTTLKQISISDRAEILGTYAAAAKHWRVHAISDDVLGRAADPFPIEPVRSLDAIHLATAVLYSQQVAQIDLLSTDARVRDNAAALGFSLLP